MVQAPELSFVRASSPRKRVPRLSRGKTGAHFSGSCSREETMPERTRVQSPFYTAEHEAFRDVMRRFVAREIEPYAHEWDEAGEFPRELYRKASEIGLLGLGFPEEYGGGGGGPRSEKLGQPGRARAR